MTSNHLFPVLENEGDRVVSLLSVGQVEAIRLGRMTALSKPDGRVRGIVVGDVLRKSSRRSKQPQLPSNTPYPPKQDVSALLTSYRP